MKNFKALLVAALIMFTTFLFTSCGVMKNNDFTTQKYTNFKKGETAVAIKKIETKNTENIFTALPTKESENIALASINYADIQKIKTADVPKLKEEYPAPVNAQKKKDVFKSKNIKKNAITSSIVNRLINKPNTASADNNSDVELLLLVILALLLPPLAVLLARGAGSEFLLSIILTILFWVPGQIYALLVVFDVI